LRGASLRVADETVKEIQNRDEDAEGLPQSVQIHAVYDTHSGEKGESGRMRKPFQMLTSEHAFYIMGLPAVP
jgi:hypothetical protein